MYYKERPDYKAVIEEFECFVELLKKDVAHTYYLPKDGKTGLDAIYTRDPALITKKGAVLSNMGKKLNEQIIQLKKTNNLLERMSVIGELTGRLVHDLRNPLSVIKMENDVAKMRIDDADEKTKQRSKRIENSIESISNIINDELFRPEIG